MRKMRVWFLSMFVLGGVSCAGLGGGLWLGYGWGVFGGSATQWLWETADVLGLRLRGVEAYVEGEGDWLGEEEVRAAVGLEEGLWLFGVDLEGARERASELPWAREASVRLVWPGLVRVRVRSREVGALWRRGGEWRTLSREGTLLPVEDIDGYRGLLKVIGDDAPSGLEVLLEGLEAAPLVRSRVVGAYRVGRRRWDLELDNGMLVKLPSRGVGSSLLLLEGLEADERVFLRKLEVIDLRVGGVMALREPGG